MVRTIIALDRSDKSWLDAQARAEGVSMTALVRRAVKLLRQRTEQELPGLEELLARTSATWEQGDGLEYQQAIRGEW